MPTNNRFSDPFWRNHCMVIAMAHLTGKSGDAGRKAAIDIASQAYLRSSGNGPISRSTRGFNAGRRDRSRLLDGRGSAWATRTPENLRQWSEISGVDLDVEKAERFHYGNRVTMATFARTHRAGSWLVFTPSHAQCVVEGEVLGSYRRRATVEMAVPVKSAPAVVWSMYENNPRWQEQLRAARAAAKAKRAAK